MSKRTNVDFSEHELHVKQYDTISIYHLKKPNTNSCNVKFIVGEGITTVTGDFGNWVFSREFHPLKNEKVSGSYWDEKLEIHSIQKALIFDTDETLKEIENYRKSLEEIDEETEEWLDRLDNSVFDELEYKNVAFREKPSHIDYEQVPYGEIRHYSLNAVYDAFEYICSKI